MKTLVDILKDMIKPAGETCEAPRSIEDIMGEKIEASPITNRTLIEIIEHEGIVLEAYLDSKDIWTWGVGVTSSSGHNVDRYINNPQTIERVLEVYNWLLETKYYPDVLKAFEGVELSESQLAAALSFHWNTGGIKRASWVKQFLAGDNASAKESFMNWRSPPEIISRRKAERDLFFEGRWTTDGLVPVYSVHKPSFKPMKAKLVDISHLL